MSMVITIKEIMIPGCMECARFKKLWEEKLSSEFPQAELEVIDATTPEGQELLVKYHIMSSPGIVINDVLFSTGRPNEKKLREKLKELSSA